MEFKKIGKEFGFDLFNQITHSTDKGDLIDIDLYYKKYVGVFKQTLTLKITIPASMIIDQKMIENIKMTKEMYLQKERENIKVIQDWLLSGEKAAIEKRMKDYVNSRTENKKEASEIGKDQLEGDKTV
jgi:hypothetical protein